MRHLTYIESYVNPIIQAKEYAKALKEERLTQNQLAKKLGISRVRITQYLNLLKLPNEQLDYIIQHGKEQIITERRLRQIAIIKDEHEQIKKFSELVNDMKIELNGELD